MLMVKTGGSILNAADGSRPDAVIDLVMPLSAAAMRLQVSFC
jgi:hypothetical protein